MIKEVVFNIFNNTEVGRLCLPVGVSYENTKAYVISPLHGRSVALKTPIGWISIKGGGWNYGGPQVYISQKDEELIFGLYNLTSAERELAVSREIEKFSDDFPKVLYYKKIADVPLPPQLSFLHDVTFANGAKVDPCLLYTKLNCPFRVADLMYLSEEEKRTIIKDSCNGWGISLSDYTVTFVKKLTDRVALLHKHGFINDTLDYGNVTLMAEIVDYEWVTAPGIKLPDGSDGQIICDERREKEILYGTEVCLQLFALLHQPYDLFSIYCDFVGEYERINPEFVKSNTRIQKILNREEFIL